MHADSRIHGAVFVAWLATGVCAVLSAGSAYAQFSEAEHLSHHPELAAGAAPGVGAAMPGAGPPGMSAIGMAPGGAPPAGGGGMMGIMGEMMKGMGKPPPLEMYPSLMALPELTPERRIEVEQQAVARIHTGTLLMGQALDALNAGARSNNFAAMHEATTRLREGIAQLQSGIAARRALADGQPPRGVALGWFKREMSLSIPFGTEGSYGSHGLSLLHLFTMALLIAFAFAMFAMYFFKMRRAAALFGRIEPGAGSPPPGSSPPLGGSAGALPSPKGKTPPSGEPALSPAKPGADSSLPVDKSSPLPQKTPLPDLAGKPVEPPQAPAGEPATPTQPPKETPAPTSSPNGATPLTAKWAGRLRIGSIIGETPSVQTFRLSAAGGGPLPFTFMPGQFLNVAFGIGGARMNRSYSISSSPNERDHVDLTVKREERGAVSRHMNDLLKVGDEIEAGGPVGKFTFSGTEAESVVLVGAGVGITPMMSVARYLTEKSWPGDIFFVYGCRAPADLIFGDAIGALARRNPKLHVAITMSKPTPEWKGARGRITREFLTQAIPNLASRRVQLCGPPAMMDSIKVLLTEIGVTVENLKTEAFGAVKPAPAAPGTSATPSPAATGPLVTFSKSNKAAKIGADRSGEQAALATGPGQTILELSEELGIGIEFSCRIGTCGVCKVKMTAGEVDMAIDDALDDDDKKNGVILACQAKPKSEVTVAA
jgi:ferredoxin-NADP reductase